jgi:hypothetical protein
MFQRDGTRVRRLLATRGKRLKQTLALAVFLFSEQRAQAEDIFGGAFYSVGGGGAAGAASLPFLVADVAYTVQGRWLPPGWAIPQVVIGGGVNAAVAVWGIMYSQTRCPQNCGEVLPVTIGTAILSVGFIAHGVASLVLYKPVPAEKTSDRIGLESHSAYSRWMPDVVITRDHSMFVTLRGVF